jgi:predicted ABC-type ATPase
MSKEKRIRIFAGPNGSGKSSAYEELSKKYPTGVYINADEIAKGLSPFQPEKVSIEAGRIMLNRINCREN